MSGPVPVFDSLAPEVRQFISESWAEFRRSERRGVSGIAGRRRQYGKRKPFDRATLLDSAARCLDMAEGSDLYDGNAYLIGALRNRRNYLIGRDGFQVEAVPAPDRTPDPSDLAAVRAFVADFLEANDFPGLTRQTLYRVDLEGNSLQRLFFPTGAPVPVVRHVELSALVPEHDGADEWGVVRKGDDSKAVEGYYVRYDDESEPEWVPEEELLHVKDDDNGTLPFGWPVFEPALEPLLQADELGGAGRARVRVQCKWAFLEKIPGLTQAGQDKYLNSLTTRRTTDADGVVRDVPTDTRTPGYGLIRQTSAAELTPVNLGGGSSDVLATKADALTEAAQAVGMAAWMFTGEVDEKFANAFAAMGPTLETFIYTQGMLVDYLVTGRIGTRASLIWRAIRMAVAAGILRRDVLDTVRLKCTPRQLQTRDRSGELSADTILYDRGLMSPDTMQARGGLDPAEEKRKGAKPFVPGQPEQADPANPAGPGVSALGIALESWAVESRAWWADVIPPARALSPVRAEQWVAEGRDLTKLVKKQITDKNGVKRTVYVRAGGKEKGKEKGKGTGSDDDDPAGVAREILTGGRPTPAKVKALAESLGKMTVTQITALKKEHGLKGGRLKAELIAKVIDYAKSKPKKTATKRTPTPTPEPEPGPTPEPEPAATTVDYQHSDPDHPAVKAMMADPELTKKVEGFVISARKRAEKRKELDAARDAETNAAAELNRLYNTSAKPPRAAVNRAAEKLRKAGQARWELERKTPAKPARDELIETFGVPAPTEFTRSVETADKDIGLKAVNPKQQKVWADAEAFAGALTGQAGGDYSYTAVKAIGGRAFCSTSRPRRIGMGFDFEGLSDKSWSGGQEAATAIHVHELGHLIEMEKPGVLEKVKEFAAYRFGDEEPVSMRDKFGGSYGAGEKGRKDHFDRALGGTGAYYVGKEYAGATEILSMGIEALYRDPHGLADKDPEYFHFLLSVLK